MDLRFREIIAATDLIIGEWDRIRPSTCQDAVELNWKLRKLQVARELLADIGSGEIRSHPHTGGQSMPGRRPRVTALYRARVE